MTARKQYKHQLVVHISSDIDRGQRQMQNRLLRWLEANGHTSVGHGFRIDAVGVITRKTPRMVGGDE